MPFAYLVNGGLDLRSAFYFRIGDALNCSDFFPRPRLPLGAPGFVPLCILHRRLPLTTGDLHSVSERTLAWQRGA